MTNPRKMNMEQIKKTAKEIAYKYYDLTKEIEKAIFRYERLSKNADKQSGTDSVTGYFNQGRRAAYDRVLLDLMSWNETIIRKGEDVR